MNWGQSFVNGLSTGHSVTQSLIDKYREQEAQRELIGVLEGLKDKQPASGQASALEGSVNLNGIGKEGAINTDTTPEKGWMDSTTEENLAKIDKARGTVDKYIGGVLDQLGTPRTFEINGLPVEDRSTEYRRNVVLPTDTGVKTVRDSFTVGGVPVEDASTPHYTNEMVRQSVEGQAQKPKTRAIAVKPGAAAGERRGPTREKAAKLREGNQTTAIPRTQAPTAAQTVRSAGGLIEGLTEGRSVGDIVASGAITPRAWRDAVDNPTSNNYPPASGTVPLTQRTPDRYRAPLVGRDPTARPSLSDHPQVIRDTLTAKMPERFAAEEQIARDRRVAEGVAAETAQLRPYGGGPVRPADQTPRARLDRQGGGPTQPTSVARASGQPAQAEAQDPNTINVGGPGDRAIHLPDGTVLGQVQTQDGRTLNIRSSDGDRAIQLQPGSGNTPIGGQGNSYTDMNYRARQRQIAVAEARYLLKVDPRAGIAAMKQINQQDAQWELSDMYRGAMQGDPTSLGKIVQFMNIGNQGGEITVSEDGRYAVVTDANGNKTQNIPITPQLIMQTLPMVQATFMTMNGMAADKAIELMQSMMTTGLQQEKLRSEVRENDATARYLDARARGAGVAPKTDPYSSTDMDGNTYTIDKTTGGPIDLRTGQIYPRGVDPDVFKQWAAEHAEWASDVHVSPEAAGLISKDGTKFLNYLTGRVENIPQEGASANPNQPTANVINGSGDTESLSIASGLIKDLEGFQSQPYSDYTQTSIGYGTRANEGEKSITEGEASKRLEDHIRTEITPKLDKALASAKVGLTPEQKASLISLCYNVGTDRFLRSSAFQALKSGDIKRFVTEVSDPERGFTKTRTAMGGLQVNPGLVERRRKEMEPFLA